ncbi:MAG: HDOD domain-containing protein [Deltaproteobacteria bacterium]|nr:MAG: HDOD domain-containing protein [Deltaproteobacteria bacterium]
MPERLENLMKRIRDLPSLPESLLEINRALEDERISIKEVCDIIERDVGLTTRVLRVANSSFYGLSGRVDTVPRALTLLGLATVKNIAVTSGIREIFRQKVPGIDPEFLWHHSLATAITMEAIHEGGSTLMKDRAFICGLIHDVGKIVLSLLFPEKMEEFTAKVSSGGSSRLEAERQTFGFDHTEAGAAAVREWRFPAIYQTIILHHHDLEMGRYDPDSIKDESVRSLLESLLVGNVLAWAILGEESPESIAERTAKLPLQSLSLPPQEVPALVEKCRARWEEARESFST